MTTKVTETLQVRINPQNCHINITNPAYVENWTRQLEKFRASFAEELKEKVASGEIEIPVGEHPLVGTPERALHFAAHTQAEQAMQRWALLGGIGMNGFQEGLDHGVKIRYIDDPSIPLFEHEVVASEN